MPVSQTPSFLALDVVAPASTYDALRELWQFMNGSHPTETNAIPWDCIEVWDGAIRSVPTDGRLTSIAPGSLWHPSAVVSLPEGAWAVFRSQGGRVAAQCQFFVRMEAAGQAGHSLIPADDWIVGGGTGASPTLPATIIGQPAIGDGDGRFPSSAVMFWSVIMDEGMFTMKQFPATGNIGYRSTYMGEVDPVTREGDDPRPFITPRDTNQTLDSSFSHVRRSPVDGTTICQIRNRPAYADTQGATAYTDLGVDYISNVGLDSTAPAGHIFTQGYMRNIGATSETALTNRATMGYTPTDFRFEVHGSLPTRPQFVTLWPSGTALLGGQTVVTEESVPDQLIRPAGPPEPEPPVARLLKTIRHLFPKSFQWNLVYARDFLSLMKGITPSLDGAANNADTLFTDLIAGTASEAAVTNWERQFALAASSALTLEERRSRLAGVWASPGGQSPGYITDTLQANGFPVYVHEWWNDAPNGYPVAKDPRDFLLPEYGGTDTDGILLVNIIPTAEQFDVMTAGETFAFAGEPEAVAGYFGGYAIGRVEYSYVGPETRHPYYLYIGGEIFPNTVDIPIARRDEFEALCKKICPAQQWIVLRVRYV